MLTEDDNKISFLFITYVDVIITDNLLYFL